MTKKEVIIRFCLWLVMVFFFLRILGKAYPWIPFLDDTNLLIHESGHVFFSRTSELVSALGGTIMQLFVPVFVTGYFVFAKKKFDAGFGAYWLGQNMVNISVYIKDARTTLLPLVNDGFHDWNKILSILGMLDQDAIIGNIVGFFGYGIMAAATAWCGYSLFNELKENAAKPVLPQNNYPAQ